MPELYLIDASAGPAAIEEPIEVDSALSGDRELWIWGVQTEEPELNLPERGDIVIFYLGRNLIGVGEVWSSSVDSAIRHYFDQAASDGYLDVGSVISLVNYQPVPRFDKSWISSILEFDETSPSSWLRNLPDIYRVPQERLAGTGKNIRALLDRIPIDATTFGSAPGGDGPNRNEGDYPPDDGDSSLGTVDHTGPLLAQQYTSRDTLKSAASGGLQIIILLFGIMIAALSFIRKAPDSVEETTREALNITTPLFSGLLGVTIAAFGAATLLTYTASNPRPYSYELSQEEERINSLIDSGTDQEQKSSLLDHFSTIYHSRIERIDRANAVIGALIGGSVGIAIASIIVFGFEVLVQISPQFGRHWGTVSIVALLPLLLLPLGIYRANFGRE